MAKHLYFIPIIAQALEQADPRAALQAAFGEIDQLGRDPQYACGWEQYQRFMKAARQGRAQKQALQQLLVGELIVELASGLFDGSDTERQAVWELVHSRAEWRTAYEQARGELSAPGGGLRNLIAHVSRDEQTIGRLVLTPTSRTTTVANITPGRYSLALDTGRVIWEGTLTEADTLWAHAFPGEPFDLAAADGRVVARPAREIPLLGGELMLRCCPGLEAGRLELESAASGRR